MSTLLAGGTRPYPELTTSYVIWVEGSVYYTKNGHTGEAPYPNVNARVVLQAVINVLP